MDLELVRDEAKQIQKLYIGAEYFLQEIKRKNNVRVTLIEEYPANYYKIFYNKFEDNFSHLVNKSYLDSLIGRRSLNIKLKKINR